MKRLTWVLAACLAALAGPARADVIYSNLGPGESYLNAAWVEAGPNITGGPTRYAFDFTVSTDTFFDSARLAVGLAGGANEIDLRLYTDAGGRPGTVLEAVHASGQMPHLFDFNSGHLVEFDSALHPLLQAGGTYWLLPFASGDTFAGWNENSQGQNGLFAESFDAEPMTWYVEQDLRKGAFEVNGTPSPAPEPSALALAGVGLVGVVDYAWRRRRKPAVA
jgi:hypothetical protein